MTLGIREGVEGNENRGKSDCWDSGDASEMAPGHPEGLLSEALGRSLNQPLLSVSYWLAFKLP